MCKQVGYLILFNARTFLLSCQPVPVNRCCFSLFRVFVYVLTKWDTATNRKVQLWLLFVCWMPQSNAIWSCYDSRELSGDDADQDDALAGKYSFVFANPEALILNEKWRKMLQSPIYQSNLFGFVTDEAHVIPKWYVDECRCDVNLLSF